MTEGMRPNFKDAAEQDYWFAQQTLKQRITNNIPDDDTRAYVTVTPRWTGMATLLGRPDPSFRIMIDEEPNIERILEEVFDGLCNSNLREEDFMPLISFSAARGQRFGSSGGVSFPYNAASIMEKVQSILTQAQKDGHLSPLEIEYDPHFESKFKVQTGSSPAP